MAVFGWFVLIIFALVGLGISLLYVVPFIIAQIKLTTLKTNQAIADGKRDIEKRSKEKQLRNDILAEKKKVLANRKLEKKVHKLETKIANEDSKMAIQKELEAIDNANKKIINEPIKQAEDKKVVKETVENFPKNSENLEEAIEDVKESEE